MRSSKLETAPPVRFSFLAAGPTWLRLFHVKKNLDACAAQQYNSATQRELSRFVALLGRFLP
jgi:hypothetical protein